MEELESIDVGWSKIEFEKVSLGDPRLDRRLIKLAEQLSGNLQVPISHATGDWASAQGAYRLFDNDKVGAKEIFAPHQERTKERISHEDFILAIQDTTYLTFPYGKDIKGLGPVGDRVNDDRGLILHHTMAVTREGLPLGFLTQDIWTRPEAKPELHHKQRPFEEKESYRWVESIRETYRCVPPETTVVTVCDREADVYEFLQEADEQGFSVLVRASRDRGLADTPEERLFERLEKAEVLGTIELAVPRQGKRERTAILEIRSTVVTLRPTHRKNKKLNPLTISVVSVREVNCPPKEQPLVWRLLTNVPVGSFEDAVERINWYRRRWHIELCHRILKTGCTVEDCLLESVGGLTKYLALFSIIAWRIFWLTYMARLQPNASPDLVISKHEQQVLKCFAKAVPAAKRELRTVKETVLAIAMLGGFLNRKNDGPPGPTPIWRGWQLLQNLSLNFDLNAAAHIFNGKTT